MIFFIFQRQSENTEYEGSQIVSNWLLKSDIKSIEGSDDIIKAICGDEVRREFSAYIVYN